MPVLDGSTQSTALARALGGFCLIGGALGLVMVVFLPLPAATDRPAMLAIIAGVGALGALLLAFAPRLPSWFVQTALMIGTLAISLDIASSARATVNDEMLYLLPACAAIVFGSPRSARAQLGLIPIGYGVALAVDGDPDGVARWLMVTGVLATVYLVVSVLLRRLRERATVLVEAEERFRSAFAEAHTGMALGGLDGTWIQVNQALASFLGYDSCDELEGHQFRDVAHPDDLAESERAFAALKSGELDGYRAEKRYVRRDGTVVWGLLSASVVLDAVGVPCRYMAQIQDISDRKAVEAELAFRAAHDPLTGLPNRALLTDRLEGALARLHRRPDGIVSVLFIDLDRFKLVNDSFGHQAGDRVVEAAAGRLRPLLRPEDTLARLGGDEFTVLLESADPTVAERVADRIVETLAAPFDVQGRPVFLSASIGIAVTTSSDADSGTLLAEADAAMYRAKELGGSRYARYTPALRTRGAERLEIEAGLRRALAEDELEIHYQPEIELVTGRIIGVEALVRWNHPERGLLAPGHFIAAAEESGLIVALGAHVLLEACAQAARWHADGHVLRVAVNLSARQLADPDLCTTVTAALTATGLPPRSLCLEITETALMDDIEVGIRALEQLSDLGVSLAIDDFGVGFSSLSQVRRLSPVDVLKIDRSFVAELGESQEDGAIIAGIVGIAHMLGLTTVAEGIETADQADGARDLGCDRAQGFHFARPTPPQEITELLAAAAVPPVPRSRAARP